MPYKDPDKKREYQRFWIAQRRLLFFADKHCRRCAERGHLITEKLELDHEDPSEKVSHRIWSWSWERIMKEAAKCQILCNSCHLDKTIKDRKKADHGSTRAYMLQHCRCDKCKGSAVDGELRNYDEYAGA